MAITTSPTKRAAEKKPRKSYLEAISTRITSSLERFFYFWGFQIAKRPCMFIGGCIAFTLLSSLGLLGLNIENRPDKLWIPADSEFIKDSDWLRSNFPSPIRIQYGLVTADDVLQPAVMKTLLEVHQRVERVTNSNRKSWNDLCFKLPVTKFGDSAKESRRRRRAISSFHRHNYSTNSVHGSASDPDFDTFEDAFSDNFFHENEVEVEEFDPSIDLPESIYCDIVNSLPEACWEVNLAELWGYNSSHINSLTKDEILKIVNTPDFVSPVFGRPINITSQIGGIERNATGHIVKAKAILLRWYNRINQTQLALGEDVTFDMGTGETTTQDNLLWEKAFINSFLSYEAPQGTKFYFKAQRSFGDISQTTIMGDGMILGVGISLGFIYVLFMLGNFNCVEQRPLLAMAGLSCIGLSVIVCYGIGSALGLAYGPVHNILPFLLLGIGIDDMFVIMQCWNNLSEKEKKMSLPERVGLTLKHAGVSITVTSITDFVAFAVGGTTILPALQSFCIFAAIGVIATYIFQATFFTSWMAMDMRRSESNRNAFCCCITHTSEYASSRISKQSIAQKVLEKVYAPILMSKPSKVLVIVATFAAFGVNIYGNSQLRQEFNPLWFLPYDSYMYQMLMTRKQYFPEMGYDGLMVMNNVTLEDNIQQLDDLETRIKATNKFSNFDFWYSDFKEYANKHFDADLPHKNLTKNKLNKYMGKFLYSPVGSKYRPRFKFDGNISCGQPSPPIQLTLTNLQFRIFKGPEEHIPAMHEVKDVVKEIEFTPNNSVRAFLWSMAFATWETEEIITVELYRNMALAMGCVLITTLLLITNLSTCIMVLSCVVLTIVDVLGGMYFWGLTIDTVSVIDMVLAIGLCVDYAAHIGHTFMTCVGTRDERAKQTIRDIGPAVLNGGFTTFLAFSLLTNSKSHVFITFFKIFFMVVMFGLYHGLVFLPVVLSIIGPKPYPSAYERHKSIVPTDIECEMPLRNGSLTNAQNADKDHDSFCNGNGNIADHELKLNPNSDTNS